MAYDAPGPLGLAWGYLALLLLPVLIVLVALYAVLGRGRPARVHTAVLVLAVLAAVVWTLGWVGAQTTITVAGHRSDCVWDPWGHGHGSNAADGPCDRALVRQLVVATGPTVLLIGLTVVGCVLRWSRRSPRTVTPGG